MNDSFQFSVCQNLNAQFLEPCCHYSNRLCVVGKKLHVCEKDGESCSLCCAAFSLACTAAGSPSRAFNLSAAAEFLVCKDETAQGNDCETLTMFYFLSSSRKRSHPSSSTGAAVALPTLWMVGEAAFRRPEQSPGCSCLCVLQLFWPPSSHLNSSFSVSV